MPGRSELRLTKRTVDALTVETRDAVFWDRDLAGFGVRVRAMGRKVYVVQSRGPAGPKRVTLGRHGVLFADVARKRAAVVIDRIKRGEAPEPMPPEPELTVAALAERYLRAHVLVHCKPSTAKTYRLVLDRHVLPAMGARVVGAVGRSEMRLPDTKTGARGVPLSPSAVKLLAGLPRVPGNPWVIPGRKPGTHLRDLDDAWKILRARAGLDDVRIHDLRHSFASRALALGESLPMIGKLLGHGKIETTARYAHLARDSVHESAGRIAESIAADILIGDGASEVSGPDSPTGRASHPCHPCGKWRRCARRAGFCSKTSRDGGRTSTRRNASGT